MHGVAECCWDKAWLRRENSLEVSHRQLHAQTSAWVSWQCAQMMESPTTVMDSSSSYQPINGFFMGKVFSDPLPGNFSRRSKIRGICSDELDMVSGLLALPLNALGYRYFWVLFDSSSCGLFSSWVWDELGQRWQRKRTAGQLGRWISSPRNGFERIIHWNQQEMSLNFSSFSSGFELVFHRSLILVCFLNWFQSWQKLRKRGARDSRMALLNETDPTTRFSMLLPVLC